MPQGRKIIYLEKIPHVVTSANKSFRNEEYIVRFCNGHPDGGM